MMPKLSPKVCFFLFGVGVSVLWLGGLVLFGAAIDTTSPYREYWKTFGEGMTLTGLFLLVLWWIGENPITRLKRNDS